MGLPKINSQSAVMKSFEPAFITIGLVLAPWGIKGNLRVEVVTDFPQRFSPSSIVYINQQPMNIDTVEWRKGQAIIKLHGVDGVEEAQRLRRQTIEIHHSQLRPLPEGEYYHFQLIGLEVWTTQGELLGNITEILTTEANDNYVVHSTKGEILIPAIEDVIKSIDLDKGRMVIEAIRGLLDLNLKGNRVS